MRSWHSSRGDRQVTRQAQEKVGIAPPSNVQRVRKGGGTDEVKAVGAAGWVEGNPRLGRKK